MPWARCDLRLTKRSRTRYYLRMNADKHTSGRLDEEMVAETVAMFRLLADETRVRLIWALLDAELSVGELAEAVGKPAAAVSQHLAKLRLARLVSTRRDGTFMYYRIDNGHVTQFLVDALRHTEHGLTPTPRHHQSETGAAPRSRKSVG